MSRGAEVVLLCEDKQHDCFFRRLLKLLGYGRIRVREDYPKGGGEAGEGFVRREFAAEAKWQRRRASRMKCGLLVVIDADSRSVDQRRNDVLGPLDPPRAANENIAIFVPKRNIETWIAYLKDGVAVDEVSPYRRYPGCESKCHPAVDRFLEIARTGVPSDCPDSLCRTIREEYPRLP
ncbi:MAG: hypothetical protein HPY44_20790 [Armatimonadetes bacterium]|nr:hypothetical protein [Armatimonadota bacterium]